MSLTVSNGLREAIHKAVLLSEKRKADKDSCPNCSKAGALASIVFRTFTVGRLCCYCEWNTFAFEKTDDGGVKKLKLVK